MSSGGGRARIVVVGSGRMGQIRAAALYANPRTDLVGIVDKDIKCAERLAEKYSALAFESLADAISHFDSRSSRSKLQAYKERSDSPLPEIDTCSIGSSISADTSSAAPFGLDGVVVSSPTFTHEEVIKEAAKHGLAIFTEKPVDETADKIEHLFDICEKAGVKLCCGFQRRFCASYAATAKAVREGKIGKPLTATIFFADHPCPPIEFLLTGGNIFSDLSAHDVDYIRWVLDDDVASVYATGTSSQTVLEEAGVHDNATMVMKFKKGSVVTLTLSRSACYGYDQRVEVFGEKGLVTLGNEHAHSSTLSDGNGVHMSTLKHSFPQRFHHAFADELDAFADTVLLKTPWPVTAQDCIAVQKVSDAAKTSCKLNKVVEIL